MTDPLISALAFLSALGSGLVAGIFFAFSSFVMEALARLPAGQGIAAMQSVNVVVLNPWFFSAFFGTAALSLVLMIASFFAWGEPGVLYLLASGLTYLVGAILVTIVCNVPLNRTLAAVAPDSADGANLWPRYVSRWTAWNHVRTAAPLTAAAFIAALL